jgi:DNA-binding transcriptional ArsR family regulator
MDMDSVFTSLADRTRRDILRRVSLREFTVGELAEEYKMSFAGVSKHIQVLQKAKLIMKRREGRHYIISLKPTMLRAVSLELETYARMWEERFNALDQVLQNIE